ncbi:MAG: hypothetical protein CM15mV65_420 [Caudoviricetes sp.]|nr:MAG: hypothetical protein CM15mV65_420 [Caudoviricetes sp.]
MPVARSRRLSASVQAIEKTGDPDKQMDMTIIIGTPSYLIYREFVFFCNGNLEAETQLVMNILK